MSRFQPQNQNLANANRFRLYIQKLPEVDFFAQRVVLPSITINSVEEPTNTPFWVPLPGDEVRFGDFNVEFQLDENYVNLIKLQTWIVENTLNSERSVSDILVQSLTNNFNENVAFRFYEAFPVAVGDVSLDTRESSDSPIMVSATFKYVSYGVDTGEDL